MRLGRWSIEVRPWRASCRRLRVAGLTLVGIITLLPFIMSPSRIVNSWRRHQYGCRCSGISCMPLGQPVRIRYASSAKVGSAFVSSCRDSSHVGSTFRTCAMLMSKLGISLALPCSTRRESVSARKTLLDPTYTTWMSYLERRNNILCNLARSRLIGFRRIAHTTIKAMEEPKGQLLVQSNRS